jgi:hypothetical protein
MQGNIYNVNKTRALLKITGGKDEPNITFYAEIVADTATQNLERKTYNRTTQKTKNGLTKKNVVNVASLEK